MGYSVDIYGNLTFANAKEKQKFKDYCSKNGDLDEYLNDRFHFRPYIKDKDSVDPTLEYETERYDIKDWNENATLAYLLTIANIDASMLVEYAGEDGERWRLIYDGKHSYFENKMYIGDATATDIARCMDKNEKRKLLEILKVELNNKTT